MPVEKEETNQPSDTGNNKLLEQLQDEQFRERMAKLISLMPHPPNIELTEYNDPPLSEYEKDLDF